MDLFLIFTSITDLGANIGVHSLFVAAMDRNVMALDAVYDNLAFIKESHDRLGVGNIKLIYNSIRSEQNYTIIGCSSQDVFGISYQL